MTANAGDLTELTKDNLPASSISVFIIGFVLEEVQDNNTFKSIKVVATEFIGKNRAGKKFTVNCRYLKSDERIDNKVIKTRKNSSIMITGELVVVDSEFQVDIQGLNFLPMSIANIEPATSNSTSSLYSWSTSTSLGRLSAQTMANAYITTTSTQTNANSETNDEDNDEDNDESTTNNLQNNSNTQSANTQTTRRKRTRRS